MKSSKEEISKDETSKEKTSVLENQVDSSDFFNPVCLNNRDNRLIIDKSEGGSDFDSKRLDFKKKRSDLSDDSEKYYSSEIYVNVEIITSEFINFLVTEAVYD